VANADALRVKSNCSCKNGPGVPPELWAPTSLPGRPSREIRSPARAGPAPLPGGIHPRPEPIGARDGPRPRGRTGVTSRGNGCAGKARLRRSGTQSEGIAVRGVGVVPGDRARRRLELRAHPRLASSGSICSAPSRGQGRAGAKAGGDRGIPRRHQLRAGRSIPPDRRRHFQHESATTNRPPPHRRCRHALANME
jgi:hypothetical protein